MSHTLGRWMAERQDVEDEGVNLEEWQARFAAGKLVTAGMQTMTDTEEATWALEDWGEYLKFIGGCRLGRRDHIYIMSGKLGPAVDVGIVGGGIHPLQSRDSNRGLAGAARGRMVGGLGRGRGEAPRKWLER